MRVPRCGCNVNTMVLGSVVETGWQILIFYTLWFLGGNSGGNSIGPLMGPGATRLAPVGLHEARVSESLYMIAPVPSGANG
jgi:hypothetical protein